MRRAVGVYERIVRRFTAQTTDYQQLLSTFAEGLYTGAGAGAGAGERGGQAGSSCCPLLPGASWQVCDP